MPQTGYLGQSTVSGQSGHPTDNSAPWNRNRRDNKQKPSAQSVTQLKKQIRQTPPGRYKHTLKLNLAQAQQFQKDERESVVTQEGVTPLSPPRPPKISTPQYGGGTANIFMRERRQTGMEALNNVTAEAPELPPDIALAISSGDFNKEETARAATLMRDELGIGIEDFGWHKVETGDHDFYVNNKTGARMTVKDANRALTKTQEVWVPAVAEMLRDNMTSFSWNQYAKLAQPHIAETGGREGSGDYLKMKKQFQKNAKNVTPLDVQRWMAAFAAEPDLADLSLQELIFWGGMAAVAPESIQKNISANMKVLAQDTSFDTPASRIGTVMALSHQGPLEDINQWIAMNGGPMAQQATRDMNLVNDHAIGATAVDVQEWKASEDPDDQRLAYLGDIAMKMAMAEATETGTDIYGIAEKYAQEGGYIHHFMLQATEEQSPRGQTTIQQDLIHAYINSAKFDYKKMAPNFQIKMEVDQEVGIGGWFDDVKRSLGDTLGGFSRDVIGDANFDTAKSGLGLAMHDVADFWAPKLGNAFEYGVRIVGAGLYEVGTLIGNVGQEFKSHITGEDFGLLDDIAQDSWKARVLGFGNAADAIELGYSEAAAETLSLGNLVTKDLGGGDAARYLGFMMDLNVNIALDPTNVLGFGVYARMATREAAAAQKLGSKLFGEIKDGGFLRSGLNLLRTAENESPILNMAYRFALGPKTADGLLQGAGKLGRLGVDAGQGANAMRTIGKAVNEADHSEYLGLMAEFGAAAYRGRAQKFWTKSFAYLNHRTAARYLFDRALEAGKDQKMGQHVFWDYSTRIFRNRAAAGGMNRQLTDKIFSWVNHQQKLWDEGVFTKGLKGDQVAEARKAFEARVEREITGMGYTAMGIRTTPEAEELWHMATTIHKAREAIDLKGLTKAQIAENKAAKAAGALVPPNISPREVGIGVAKADMGHIDPNSGESLSELSETFWDRRWKPKDVRAADSMLADFIDPEGYFGMARVTKIPGVGGVTRYPRLLAGQALSRTEAGRKVISKIHELSSAVPSLVSDIEGPLDDFVENWMKRSGVFSDEEIQTARMEATRIMTRAPLRTARAGARERAYIKFMQDLSYNAARKTFEKKGIFDSRLITREGKSWAIKGTGLETRTFKTKAEAERFLLDEMWHQVGWDVRRAQAEFNGSLFGISADVLEKGVDEGVNPIDIIARGRAYHVRGKTYETLDKAKAAARRIAKKEGGTGVKTKLMAEINIQHALYETQLPNQWAMWDPKRLEQALDEAIGYKQATSNRLRKIFGKHAETPEFHDFTATYLKNVLIHDIGDRLLRIWKIATVATPRYIVRVPLGDEQFRMMNDMGVFNYFASRKWTSKLFGDKADGEFIFMPVHVGSPEINEALASSGLDWDTFYNLKVAADKGILLPAQQRLLNKVPDWVHDVVDNTFAGVKTSELNPKWDEIFGAFERGEKPKFQFKELGEGRTPEELAENQRLAEEIWNQKWADEVADEADVPVWDEDLDSPIVDAGDIDQGGIGFHEAIPAKPLASPEAKVAAVKSQAREVGNIETEAEDFRVLAEQAREEAGLNPATEDLWADHEAMLAMSGEVGVGTPEGRLLTMLESVDEADLQEFPALLDLKQNLATYRAKGFSNLEQAVINNEAQAKRLIARAKAAEDAAKVAKQQQVTMPGGAIDLDALGPIHAVDDWEPANIGDLPSGTKVSVNGDVGTVEDIPLADIRRVQTDLDPTKAREIDSDLIPNLHAVRTKSGRVVLVDGRHRLHQHYVNLLGKERTQQIDSILDRIAERVSPSVMQDEAVKGTAAYNHKLRLMDGYGKLEARHLHDDIFEAADGYGNTYLLLKDETGQVVGFFQQADETGDFTQMFVVDRLRGTDAAQRLLKEHITGKSIEQLEQFVDDQMLSRGGGDVLGRAILDELAPELKSAHARVVVRDADGVNLDKAGKYVLGPKGDHIGMRNGAIGVVSPEGHFRVFRDLSEAEQKVWGPRMPQATPRGVRIAPGQALVLDLDDPMPVLEQLNEMEYIGITGSRWPSKIDAGATDAEKAEHGRKIGFHKNLETEARKKLQSILEQRKNAGVTTKPIFIIGDAKSGADKILARVMDELDIEYHVVAADWNAPMGHGVSVHPSNHVAHELPSKPTNPTTLSERWATKKRWEDARSAQVQKVSAAKAQLTKIEKKLRESDPEAFANMSDTTRRAARARVNKTGKGVNRTTESPSQIDYDEAVEELRQANESLASFGNDPEPGMVWVDKGSEWGPGPIYAPWKLRSGSRSVADRADAQWRQFLSRAEIDDLSEEAAAALWTDRFWKSYENSIYDRVSRLGKNDFRARQRLMDLRGKYLMGDWALDEGVDYDTAKHLNNVIMRINMEEQMVSGLQSALWDAGIIGDSVSSDWILQLLKSDNPIKVLKGGGAHIDEMGTIPEINEVLRSLSDAKKILLNEGLTLDDSPQYQEMLKIAEDLFKKHNIRRGVDQVIKSGYTVKRGKDLIVKRIPPPDWQERVAELLEDTDFQRRLTVNRRAGFDRNTRMAHDYAPQAWIGFWDGTSSGTAHQLGLAKKRGVPTILFGKAGEKERNAEKFLEFKLGDRIRERNVAMGIFGFYDPKGDRIVLNVDAYSVEDWRKMEYALDGRRVDEVLPLTKYRPETLVGWHEEGHAVWTRLSDRQRARWHAMAKNHKSRFNASASVDDRELFGDFYMLWQADPLYATNEYPELAKLMQQRQTFGRAQKKAMEEVEVVKVSKFVKKGSQEPGVGPQAPVVAWNLPGRTGLLDDEAAVSSNGAGGFIGQLAENQMREEGMAARLGRKGNVEVDADHAKWGPIDPKEVYTDAVKAGKNGDTAVKTLYAPQWHRALAYHAGQSGAGKLGLQMISGGASRKQVEQAIVEFYQKGGKGVAERLGLYTADQIADHAALTTDDLFKLTMDGDRDVASMAISDPDVGLKVLIDKLVSERKINDLPRVHGQSADMMENGRSALGRVADLYMKNVFEKATNKMSRQPYYKFQRKQHEMALLGQMRLNGVSMDPDMARKVKMFAREQAISDTWELLFDFRKNNRMAEIMRFFVPFAQPFAEALTVWGRLFQKNPNFFVHIAQIGKTLTQYDVVEQDMNGQWVMKVPFVGDFMASVGSFLFPGSIKEQNSHYNLVFPLASFNFALSSNIPIGGVPVPVPSLWGPGTWMVQNLSDSKFVPEWMKGPMADYAYQYGSLQQGGGFVRAMMPTWMSNFAAAMGWTGTQNDLYTQDFLQLMESQGITGVSLATDPDLARSVSGGRTFATVEDANYWLLQEAENKAQNFGLMRWFFGSIFPAPPIIRMDTYSAQKYYEELKEAHPDDFDKVRDLFLAKYPDNTMVLTAATMWDRPDLAPTGVPATEAVRKLFESGGAEQLMAINPQLLFALIPDEAWSDEMDRVEWMRQVDQGWRRVKTPEEFLGSWESTEGWRAFFQAREIRDAHLASLEAQGVQPSDELYKAEQQSFGDVIDGLKILHPGFANEFDGEGSAAKAGIIGQIEKALQIPEFASTGVGQGLEDYMEGRKELIKKMEGYNISTIDNETAIDLGIADEYEGLVADLMASGDTAGMFYEQFLRGDLTEDYVFTKAERIRAQLDKLPNRQEVIESQANWNNIEDRIDAWEPGGDPADSIAELYNMQRSLSNEWLDKYGLAVANPQWTDYETKSWSEKREYILGLSSRPFQYMSTFDKEYVLGMTTSDDTEAIWDDINALGEIASSIGETDPRRDSQQYYDAMDRIADEAAMLNPEFRQQLTAANEWGWSFFQATGYGQKGSPSDAAWASVHQLVQRYQSLADGMDMRGADDSDERKAMLYIGFRRQLIGAMEQLAVENPTFGTEFQDMRESYDSFINVLIPENYYRLGT